jgi:hypothetical protein
VSEQARKRREPHQQLKLPRCRHFNRVRPSPYKRRKYPWGEVHYVRCECGRNDAIDVL